MAPQVGYDPGRFGQFRTMMRELPEDVWWPLYDKVNYPSAGVGSLTFFSTPRGQNATLLRMGTTTAGETASATRAKTLMDSNVEQAGVLPTKAYKIYGLKMQYTGARVDFGGTNPHLTGSDKQILALAGVVEFRIIDKPYLQIPLADIPEPVGMAYTAGGTTNTGGYWGTGNPRDCYWLGVPLVLEPFQNFQIVITFDGSPILNRAMDVQLELQGMIRRPGQ